MKRYAMTINNKVIGVVESEEKPMWGNDERGNKVVAVEIGGDTVVDLGMVYVESTKTFIIQQEEPEKTQLDVIQEYLEKTVDELRQEGANAVLTELQKRGVLK